MGSRLTRINPHWGLRHSCSAMEPDSKQNAWQGIDDNFRNFAQAGSNDYVLDDKVPSASVISTKSLSLR